MPLSRSNQLSNESTDGGSHRLWDHLWLHLSMEMQNTHCISYSLTASFLSLYTPSFVNPSVRIDDHPSYFWPCIYLKPVLSGINNDFDFFLMNTVKLRVMAKFKKVQKLQEFFYFPPILRNLYCFLFPVTLPLCSLNLVLIYTLDQELCYQNLFTPLLIC